MATDARARLDVADLVDEEGERLLLVFGGAADLFFAVALVGLVVQRLLLFVGLDFALEALLQGEFLRTELFALRWVQSLVVRKLLQTVQLQNPRFQVFFYGYGPPSTLRFDDLALIIVLYV